MSSLFNCLAMAEMTKKEDNNIEELYVDNSTLTRATTLREHLHMTPPCGKDEIQAYKLLWLRSRQYIYMRFSANSFNRFCIDEDSVHYFHSQWKQDLIYSLSKKPFTGFLLPIN